MNRRHIRISGLVLAAASIAVVIALSAVLSAERRGDRQRYTDALTQQRLALGRALPPTEGRARAPARVFCVRGVTGPAQTIREGLPLPIVDDDGRIDIARFLRLSDLAVRAQRYLEQANAGPALPQRLGRTRRPPAERELSANGDPTQSGQPTTPNGTGATSLWYPLQPAQVPCQGHSAYATIRLDID